MGGRQESAKASWEKDLGLFLTFSLVLKLHLTHVHFVVVVKEAGQPHIIHTEGRQVSLVPTGPRCCSQGISAGSVLVIHKVTIWSEMRWQRWACSRRSLVCLVPAQSFYTSILSMGTKNKQTKKLMNFWLPLL